MLVQRGMQEKLGASAQELQPFVKDVTEMGHYGAGDGSGVTGDSVRARSDHPEAVGAYAVRSPSRTCSSCCSTAPPTPAPST